MGPAIKPSMAIWGAIAIFLTPFTGSLHAQNLASPANTAFDNWALRYGAETNQSARAALLVQGVSAARERRTALKSLMESDPRAALALNRSLNNPAALPPEVRRELETPFNGTGDFIIQGAVAADGGPPVQSLRRFVRLGARTYHAHAFGQRLGG